VEDLQDSHSIFMGHIQPWYSGTGYHIQLHDAFGFAPGTDIPAQVKATFTKHFAAADDIYDRTRLLRVAHTLNTKSGLYKIPLHPSELFTMSHEEIMALAAKPRMDFRWEETEEPLTKHLSKLIIIPEPKTRKQSSGIALTASSNGIVTCMQNLYARGEFNGSRHQDLLRLASAWRRGGVPFKATCVGLRDWASTMDAGEVDRIVGQVFQEGYKYSCQDKTMQKWCDPSCIFYKNKDFAIDIASAAVMEQNFVKFANTDFATTSFDLAEFYMLDRVRDGKGGSKAGSYKIYPGELVTIIGDTGTGKTAWLQNLCCSLKRMDILYLSLEVHQNLLYRRFIQIEHGMTKDSIVEHYQSHTNSLSQAIKHIQCITMAVDIATIHRLVAEMRPRIVVVDVLDGINVPGNLNENQKGEVIARELKQIAMQQNVIIIGIHHISKGAAENPLGKAKRMTVHSGKGASTLEQKSDKLIAIEGNRDEPVRIVTSLKSRDETNFRLAFKVDDKTFRFEQQI
jgi:hypothetical protein